MKKTIKLILILSFSLNVACLILFFGVNKSKPNHLNLKPIQVKKISGIRSEYNHRNTQLKNKIRDCNRQLLSILESDSVTKEEVYKCVEEINALQMQLQKNSVDEIIKIKQSLNKKQCKCFITKIAKGMGESRPCACVHSKNK